MSQVKQADQKQANVRATSPERERVFKEGNHWFFHIREGKPRGPYIDKQHAYWALAKYIRQQCSFR